MLQRERDAALAAAAVDAAAASEKVWAQFRDWALRKSVSPAKVVVEAALSKLPLDKRQEFIITDVQRAIDMGLGDVCKDLIRVETVVKRWGLGPAPAL